MQVEAVTTLRKRCEFKGYSLVAQPVERETVNFDVPGSSPGQGATLLIDLPIA